MHALSPATAQSGEVLDRSREQSDRDRVVVFVDCGIARRDLASLYAPSDTEDTERRVGRTEAADSGPTATYCSTRHVHHWAYASSFVPRSQGSYGKFSAADISRLDTITNSMTYASEPEEYEKRDVCRDSVHPKYKLLQAGDAVATVRCILPSKLLDTCLSIIRDNHREVSESQLEGSHIHTVHIDKAGDLHGAALGLHESHGLAQEGVYRLPVNVHLAQQRRQAVHTQTFMASAVPADVSDRGQHLLRLMMLRVIVDASLRSEVSG
ncbi:hypothetical protein FI667_g10115, partial [Globisporangium splendens]